MNLLTVNPISSCNLYCEHCPNREWTYPVNDKRNRLNNEIIFKWINKYINPYEWFIEVSGGEPGLYPEIHELVQKFSHIGYHGIIRTNGTLPIPKADNFRRIAAWHKPTGIANPPVYCDVMLITKNPDDCWQDKAEYCENNNIPYKCVPYVRFGDASIVDEPPQGAVVSNSFFKYWTIVNSYGEQAYCYADWGDERDNIVNMSPPLLRVICCPDCNGVLGTLEFLDDDIVEMLNMREIGYLQYKQH